MADVDKTNVTVTTDEGTDEQIVWHLYVRLRDDCRIIDSFDPTTGSCRIGDLVYYLIENCVKAWEGPGMPFSPEAVEDCCPLTALADMARLVLDARLEKRGRGQRNARNETKPPTSSSLPANPSELCPSVCDSTVSSRGFPDIRQ